MSANSCYLPWGAQTQMICPFLSFVAFLCKTTFTGLKEPPNLFFSGLLVAVSFSFMQVFLWAVEWESPLCLSEFRFQTGVPLHLGLFCATQQWKESNENLILSYKVNLFLLIGVLSHPATYIPDQFHRYVYCISIISPTLLSPEALLCRIHSSISNSWLFIL